VTPIEKATRVSGDAAGGESNRLGGDIAEAWSCRRRLNPAEILRDLRMTSE
jgi:hypothetical protein